MRVSLGKEYSMYPTSAGVWLYHRCTPQKLPATGIVCFDGTSCSKCGKETPKNIMFSYKLWEWNNRV